MSMVKKRLNDIYDANQGVYDSTSVSSDRDGNLFERTEYLINSVLNTLPYQLVQSNASTVAQNTFGSFSVQIYNSNGDPYPVDNIDISSATPLMYQSRGGNPFSTVGITPPVITKDLGLIEIFYNFPSTEWQPDDLYKLEIRNVYITNGETIKLQTFIWNNVISLVNDLDMEIDAIVTYLSPPDIDSSGNTTIAEMVGKKGDTPKTNTTASIINILKSLVASQLMRRCNISNVGDITHFTSTDFPTASTGTFNGWYAYVHQDNDGDVAPRGEYRLITDWNNSTGIFTHEAFSAPLTTGNKMLIVNPNVYAMQLIKPIIESLPDAGALTSLAQGTDLATLDGKCALETTNLLIKAKTDTIVSGGATEANVNLVKAKTDLIVSGGATESNVNAVKAKTDLITSDPALQTTLNLVKTETDKIPATIVKIDSIKTFTDSLYTAQKVYPTLAAGISVTTSGTSWILGSFTQIVPINTITSTFSINHVNVSTASANTTYELVLYSGLVGNEVEIGRCRFTRVLNTYTIAPVPIRTPLISANTRISAKVACSLGSVETIVMTIYY